MTPSQKGLIKPRTSLFAGGGGGKLPKGKDRGSGYRQLAEQAGKPATDGRQAISDVPEVVAIGAWRFTAPGTSTLFARLSRALSSSAGLSQRLRRAVERHQGVGDQ
jgi:hypothetical protein